MVNQEVIVAFNQLLQQLDAAIPELNQQGSYLFARGKYDQARAILTKVEAIIKLRGKVKALEEEWKSYRVPTQKKTLKVEPSTKYSLRAGLKTNKNKLRMPILEALIRLNGTGEAKDVLELVERIMDKQLNDYDRQSLSSHGRVIRWENSARWARHDMVQEGLLSSNSPRGVWQITDAGRDSFSEYLLMDHSNQADLLFQLGNQD